MGVARAWVRRLVLGPVAVAGIVYAQSDTHRTDPFTPEERIQYFLHRTVGWRRMTTLGLDTAVSHVVGGSAGWGAGSSALGYRYGASFSSRVTRNTIELGLGLALHEDIRYKRSEATGVRA